MADLAPRRIDGPAGDGRQLHVLDLFAVSTAGATASVRPGTRSSASISTGASAPMPISTSGAWPRSRTPCHGDRTSSSPHRPATASAPGPWARCGSTARIRLPCAASAILMGTPSPSKACAWSWPPCGSSRCSSPPAGSSRTRGVGCAASTCWPASRGGRSGTAGSGSTGRSHGPLGCLPARARPAGWLSQRKPRSHRCTPGQSDGHTGWGQHRGGGVHSKAAGGAVQGRIGAVQAERRTMRSRAAVISSCSSNSFVAGGRTPPATRPSEKRPDHPPRCADRAPTRAPSPAGVPAARCQPPATERRETWKP